MCMSNCVLICKPFIKLFVLVEGLFNVNIKETRILLNVGRTYYSQIKKKSQGTLLLNK